MFLDHFNALILKINKKIKNFQNLLKTFLKKKKKQEQIKQHEVT